MCLDFLSRNCDLYFYSFGSDHSTNFKRFYVILCNIAKNALYTVDEYISLLIKSIYVSLGTEKACAKIRRVIQLN